MRLTMALPGPLGMLKVRAEARAILFAANCFSYEEAVEPLVNDDLIRRYGTEQIAQIIRNAFEPHLAQD